MTTSEGNRNRHGGARCAQVPFEPAPDAGYGMQAKHFVRGAIGDRGPKVAAGCASPPRIRVLEGCD